MNRFDSNTSSVSRTALLTGGTALAAAPTAAWVARSARNAERANPPSGRMLDVDGVRLHVVERGNGPPVVLIHGNTVTHRDFEACGLIDRLASRLAKITIRASVDSDRCPQSPWVRNVARPK